MSVAIVTGGESGIGKASCVALARAGFDVGLTWHFDADAAAATVAEVQATGRRAASVWLDLADVATVGPALDELADALGGLDVFVNNAGTRQAGPFLELPFEEWRRTLAINLDGAFACLQHAARRMVRAGTAGRIVVVTSVHEHVALRNASAYCASKGGLGLLVKTMAIELAEHGIAVNAVAPGATATPMTDAHDVDPATLPRPDIPVGRPAHAAEIAAAVAFLARDARYVTGTSLVVDGGLTLERSLG
jgi:NAD(P)-dependent dehydrogenase (short-subunit alcohol dehydrogenase family)